MGRFAELGYEVGKIATRTRKRMRTAGQRGRA